MHPELPVQTTDGTACGRNYFSRPSAPEQEEDAEERSAILQEMKQLKQLAVDYMHPELPVTTTDGTACGRNYFSRASAEEYEEEDMADEREDIMEDLAQLKQLAVDYMHPELPVVTSDPTACGRNYFSRPSAKGNDEEQDEEYELERAQALEDARVLKQLAVDYLHPELPVVTTDGTACGRNYFSRASAEEYDEQDEERDLILSEMAQLKKLAMDYMHPERPVATDGFATARNYFSRASAPEQVALEDANEETRIRKELEEMKKLAEDYLSPEKPVNSTAPGARSYFDRASAAGHAEHIHTRKESIDGAMDNDNAFAYHEQVLGLVAGEHDYHDHSEHFDMEEDLQTFKDNLRAMAPQPQIMSKEKTAVSKGDGLEEEEEGNLSRSPSSVMLFELAGC
jgi:hypothetical protein